MIEPKPTSTIALISWALYDWANSAFFAVIQTFVFATYFMQSVAVDDTLGSTQWGNTIGAAGLVIALSAPFMGAVADQLGKRKPWIAGFSGLCIVCTAALWFIKPSPELVAPALIMIFLSTLGSELAIIFYNSMLPDLVSEERVGRWSGWAWGMGYAGGLCCLILALLVFVDSGQPPFGLSKADAGHVRATFVLVAVWYFLFSLPLFLKTADRPGTGIQLKEAMRSGWDQLKDSVRQVKRFRNIFRFLIARMIFIDALATIFAFGGIYAAGTFDLDEREVLLFGIGLNLTAGLGAVLFAWIDDWLGSRDTMLWSLAGLVVTTTALLVTKSLSWFWGFGLLLGIFVGPVQAASRSFMARVAPRDLRNQMFGLLALSGKATAFAGPLLVGWLTFWTGSQRIGMSVIVVLFILGMILLKDVPRAKGSVSD